MSRQHDMENSGSTNTGMTMPDLRFPSAEDAEGLKGVSDAQISPDGELVTFVVGYPELADEKRPKSHIWAVPANGGDPRQLTAGPRSDSSPRWSPDGKTLAFLSDREEKEIFQIYLLPRTGGEALQLTSLDGGVSIPGNLDPIAWSRDGKRIAYLRTDPQTEEEKRRKKEKDDAIEFERSPKFARLYIVDLESGESDCVSPDALQVWEFSWWPGDDGFVAVASDLPFDWSWYTCRLVAFSAEGGPARTLHRTRRQVAKPTISPDGGHVAFLSSNWSDRGMAPGGVFAVPLKGGDARELSADHVASATSLAWSADGSKLLTTADERSGTGLAEIEVATGQRTSLWHGFAVTSDIAPSDRDGNLPFARSDPTSPSDVWLAKVTQHQVEWTKLTDLNPQVAEFRVGETEPVRWKGADGWEVHGLIIRPEASDFRGPHPMITMVHGGPTGSWSPGYNLGADWSGVLEHGIAVFLPNPRGSTGRGLEFAESNIGDMGGKDWEDILAGVEHCVSEGIADPDRLGIGGGSYGGYMTAWAVTQTDRFKAAVMRAGISDWRSFHGRSTLAGWESIHYGDADPYDLDGTYRKFSPIAHLKRVKTPTLIIHGELDPVCPVEQAYLFHRALKDLGVETELVIYPREGHGTKERAHRLDQRRRTVKWFVDRLAQ